MFFTKKTNGATCHGVKNSWVKLTKQYEPWTDIEQSYKHDVDELFCNLIFWHISHIWFERNTRNHTTFDQSRRQSKGSNLYIDGFWRSHALKPPEVKTTPWLTWFFPNLYVVFLTWFLVVFRWIKMGTSDDLAFSKSSAEMPRPLSITF